MTCRSGVSVLELAIVVVISGLLIGTIVSARGMLHASECQAVIGEHTRYAAAITTFSDKYFALPGDMPEAYRFWGPSCGTNTTDASTGCNGDGDNFIEPDQHGEQVKVWEHLARGGIIDGKYDGQGTIDPTGQQVTPSPTNSPASKLRGGYWEFSDYFRAASFPEGQAQGLYLSLGALGTRANVDYALPTLSRQDAQHIDAKTDDGKADSGSLRGNSAAGGCFDASGHGAYGADASLGGDPDAKDCTLTFVAP